MTRLPHRIIGFLIIAAAAWADCPSDLRGTTGNFAADLFGPVDTRPGSGTGSHADAVIIPFHFTNVPAGCRVQIVEVHVDFIGGPLDTPQPGHFGVLVAAAGTTAMIGGGSKYADLAADGYAFYHQRWSGSGEAVNLAFDQKVVGCTLDADNILQLKLSSWMNTVGVKIHIELTISQIVFQYVPQGGEGR